MTKRELKLIKGNGHKRVRHRQDRPSVSLRLVEAGEVGQSSELTAAPTVWPVSRYPLVAEPAHQDDTLSVA